METRHGYDLVRPLFKSGRYTIYEAERRRGNREESYAVWLNEGRDDAQSPTPNVPALHLLATKDKWTDERGRWTVTDLWDSTVADLIEDRVSLSGRAIHHVLTGILDALAERTAASQESAEPELDANRVLLLGRGGVAESRVVVAVSSRSDPAIRQADLRAAGRILFRLVCGGGEPTASQANRRDRKWETAFPGRAEAWQRLCDSLLAGDDKLPELRNALALLRPPKSMGQRARTWAPATAAALLVVGCAAYLRFGASEDSPAWIKRAALSLGNTRIYPDIWRVFRAESGDWFVRFVEAAPEVAQLLFGSTELDLQSVVTNFISSSSLSNLTSLTNLDARAAHARAADLRTAVDAAHKARAVLEDWKEKHWQKHRLDWLVAQGWTNYEAEIKRDLMAISFPAMSPDWQKIIAAVFRRRSEPEQIMTVYRDTTNVVSELGSIPPTAFRAIGFLRAPPGTNSQEILDSLGRAQTVAREIKGLKLGNSDWQTLDVEVTEPLTFSRLETWLHRVKARIDAEPLRPEALEALERHRKKRIEESPFCQLQWETAMSVVKTNSNKRNLTTLLPAIYEFNRAVAAFPAAGIRGLPGFHPDPNDALAFLVQTVSLKRELTISNAYLEAKVDPDSWMPDIKFQTNFWSEGANQSIHDLYSGWLGALTNLAIEVRSIPDWMAAGCYGPALALYDRGRSNEVWGAVATALGIDEPGLRQLVAIRDAPPGKRMPVLQATVKPESSLTSLRAVWDRFGHAAHDWPEDEGSFQILVNLQETLWRKAGEFPRTACAEMPDLRAELLDEGPKLMTAIFRCFHEDAGIARELDRLRDKLLLKNIATRLSTRSEWQFNHHLLEQRRAVGLLAESPDPKLLAAGRDELMRRYGSLSGPSPFSQNKMVPIQNIDFSRPIVVNPNRTNWSVKPGRDGELNFELAGVRRSSVRVTFLLVQPPDIPAFYLATTEVSVGLVAAMTDRRYWQTNRAAYLLNWGGERDIRTGIVTWQLDEGNRFGPAARWADPHGPMAAWAERKDEVPSPDHPMTYVSPERARDLADRMGFRLPTLAEWQAAAALYPNSARNLFDQRVSNAVIVAMKNKDDAPWLPNQDSYIPRQVGKVTSHTDPWFFFSRVNEGGGAGDLFKHLIGNVWEITQSDLSSYSILGGSLFTDAPDLKVPPIPITPGATTRGYSDVGFRLAMDASPAEQYRHWLSQLAYAR